MRQGSKLRKIWLVALAVMAVLFLVLAQIVSRSGGVPFCGALLEAQGAADNGSYTGKTHGETVNITVRRQSETAVEMNLSISNVADETWLVEYPLEPVLTEHGQKLPGLRVSRNGKTVFEGAYDPDHRVDWGYMLYDTDGKWYAGEILSITAGTGPEGGYWDDYETSLNTVLKFVNGPELEARGNLTFWFYGLVLSAMAAVLVAFPEALFQMKHHWHVKDPEPTDFYYVENCIAAGIITIAALAAYIAGVCTIP